MKTSKILAIAALSLSTLVGTAQAEEYQGVLPPVSALSRTEVQQQAVGAAHAANQNVSASSIAMGPLQAARDRAAVQAEAMAAAHDGTQNLVRGAFVNSQLPTQFQPTAVGARAAL